MERALPCMNRGLLSTTPHLPRVTGRTAVFLPHRIHPFPLPPFAGEQTRRVKHRHLRAVVVLAALFAASCATYVPLSVTPRENASDLGLRTLGDPALRRFIEQNHTGPEAGWPPKAWTPELLVLAALHYQPSLDVARAQWQLARAAQISAAERPNPTLNIGAEHKATGGGVIPWVTTLSLDVPIETAGKRSLRIDQARAISAAAAAEIDQAVWNVRSAVQKSLVEVAAAGRLRAALAEQSALRAEIADMYERRLTAGEASQPDLTRARIEATQARLASRSAASAEESAMTALAGAIAIPTEAVRGATLDLSSIENVPPSLPPVPVLRKLALTTRPDIIAALARFRAADSGYRLELRRQYPDIHVGPGLGWDQGAFRWALSLSAELPLLNRHRGPIAEAMARRDVAAAALLDLQARILGSLDHALAAEAAARRRVADAARVLDLNERKEAAAGRQFDAGEIDRLALRSQQIEVALARADAASATSDLHRAVTAVEDALERPVTSIEEGVK